MSDPIKAKEHGSKGGKAPRFNFKTPLRPGERRVQITRCARCGGRHSLLAKPLINACGSWKLYATCRRTRQPILIRVKG